jgi:hypothetical protein
MDDHGGDAMDDDDGGGDWGSECDWEELSEVTDAAALFATCTESDRSAYPCSAGSSFNLKLSSACACNCEPACDLSRIRFARAVFMELALSCSAAASPPALPGDLSSPKGDKLPALPELLDRLSQQISGVYHLVCAPVDR